ncbi:glycosyltransferase family 2 protein [Cognataquiflexum rubidum]|uniref:glycosyltransferase family 2 protein n=1 Tax=Cognataquiflexum rubidum TaxID=2922273 RepID=UPI001F14604D|nr:glycosyltransferase family 2 protein [Cognataquiflexum rubidum]MCH6234036.1 glycosyltransferase [Cognataquiflexum rubidum]
MKVSICIPTYNQALYLEQTIRSCADQTISPFEIIVSDDCSTDNTKDILSRLGDEIPILKIIHQPVNLGMVPNTDSVLRKAKGDYIIKLDSDDYLAPNYLAKLSNLLDKYPKAGYAHAAVQEIDEKGQNRKKRVLMRNTGFITSETALQEALQGYKVSANIIMFRKSALEKVGFINAKTNFAEDFYLSAELASAGFGNVYLNEVLSFYRVWTDAGQVRQRRKLAEIEALRRVFEEVLEPAFKARNWGGGRINKFRASFATRHANSLGWDIYTPYEKEEIAKEILKLSSNFKVKSYVWLYQNGLGGIPGTISSMKSILKGLVKKIAFSLIPKWGISK